MKATKRRFIDRYKKAVMDFFYYPSCDREGRIIRHYIINEYENILIDEFDVAKSELLSMYQDLYQQAYDQNGQLKERKNA